MNKYRKGIDVLNSTNKEPYTVIGYHLDKVLCLSWDKPQLEVLFAESDLRILKSSKEIESDLNAIQAEFINEFPSDFGPLGKKFFAFDGRWKFSDVEWLPTHIQRRIKTYENSIAYNLGKDRADMFQAMFSK